MSKEDRSIAEKPPCSIFEITADLLDNQDLLLKLPSESAGTLQIIKKLLLSLGSGNHIDLEKCLIEFGVKKESHLFEEVGRMTRTLHNSLEDFQASLCPESLTMTTTNIPDATSKLEAVIKMTADSANKTMDNMEQQAILISELKADLQAYKLRCNPSQQKDSFFGKLEDRLTRLDQIGSETLIGQSFQDLTGQSIRKVIKLVSDLESNLISIVKVFGLKDNKNTAVINEQTNSQKVDQDDVDSLLSDLGF